MVARLMPTRVICLKLGPTGAAARRMASRASASLMSPNHLSFGTTHTTCQSLPYPNTS